MRGDSTQNSSSLKGIGTLSSRGVFGDLGSLFGVWGDPWTGGKSSGSEKKRGNFSGSVGVEVVVWEGVGVVVRVGVVVWGWEV